MRKSSYTQMGQSDTERVDPITLYNRVIEEYNNPANSINNVPLDQAYNDVLYRAWYKLLRHWYILMFILYLAPYLTFVTVVLTVYTLIIHENSLAVYRKNAQGKDIFENMVPCDSLCEKADVHYLYFTVDKQDLVTFPFSQGVVQALVRRIDEATCKVRFMVYDRVFLAWSEGLKKPRWLIVSHLLVNMALFVIMQVWVYAPFLCFNLLHPIDSISKCRTTSEDTNFYN